MEKKPDKAEILTITREEALNSWKVEGDKEYLLITCGNVIETDTGHAILGCGTHQVESNMQNFWKSICYFSILEIK